MTTLYGIRNCDTMKKARTRLAEQGIEHDFHDYKKAGISAGTLRAWAAQVGWKTLLNTRGMTWRKVSQEVRDRIDEESAIALMREHPGMIKRPVLEHAGELRVGFKPEQYQRLFGKQPA